MKPVKYKFQMIKVEDHYSDNADWVDPVSYVPEKKFLEYVGWVIQEDDDLITLAQGRSMEGKHYTYDNLMHVMKMAIVRRKTIKIE